MSPTSVARRTLVSLLVLALAAVGVSAPWHEVVRAGNDGPGAAVGVARVDATAPSRAAGRLVAEPALVCVHGPELPFGEPPGEIAPAALARAAGERRAAPAVRCPGQRGTPDERAPPARRTAS